MGLDSYTLYPAQDRHFGNPDFERQNQRRVQIGTGHFDVRSVRLQLLAAITRQVNKSFHRYFDNICNLGLFVDEIATAMTITNETYFGNADIDGQKYRK